MKFSFLGHHNLVSRQRHRLSSPNGDSTVYNDFKNPCTFSWQFYDLWWLTNTYNNPTARAPHSNWCHAISKPMRKTLRVENGMILQGSYICILNVWLEEFSKRFKITDIPNYLNALWCFDLSTVCLGFFSDPRQRS